MKDENGSRDWSEVDTLEAAQFLANRQELAFLKPYLRQARTVKEAGSELGIGITAMYKKTQRMLQLGLLEVSSTSPRAGRSTKHYQATKPRFFIPSKLFPAALTGQANRKRYLEIFEGNMGRIYRNMETALGISTALTEAGELYLNITYADGKPWDYLEPMAPVLLAGWNPLQLEPSEAKALQLELYSVISKYLGKRGSKTYLSGLFLCEMVT